jgi:hypothetical protein
MFKPAVADDDGGFVAKTYEEEWRYIPGYEGLYAVSNYGDVLSLPKPNYKSKPKMLKQTLNGHGYPCVTLSKDGKLNIRYVHSYVAAAFIGPRPLDMDICHNNGVKTDTGYWNLRHDDREANMADALIHGGLRIGESHQNTKYTDAQVREVKRLASTHSPTEIANITGVKLGTVYDIRSGVRRKYV